MYCLSFLGLTALYRGRTWLGGALLALASALKYMPSFFLLLLAIQRRWRAVIATLLAYVMWILVFPTLVHGPARHIELLALYQQKAAKTYRGMVSGDYTSSLSLRSTVMRMTSEVKPRLPDPDVYDYTIVKLPKETARRLSEAVAIGVLLATIIVTWVGVRRCTTADLAESPGEAPTAENTLSPLHTLLVIGFWYTMLLMISPETRTPHFLTLFTPAFALGVTLANWEGRTGSRSVVKVLLFAAVMLLLAVSEIFEKARYHLIASGLGAYAWAQVAIWLACLVALLEHSCRSSSGRSQN